MKLIDVVGILYSKIIIIDKTEQFELKKDELNDLLLNREIAGIRARTDMFLRPYLEINLVQSNTIE